MTHETDDGTADIAWMRKLAEEGATTPMKGGSILMSAGLIYGAASVFHWAVISGVIDADPSTFSLVWLVATALFLGVLALITLRLRGEGGVRTAANKASQTAWSSIGWGIFAMFASIAVAAARLGEDGLILLSLAPSIIMVFYGLGWAVSAAMTTTKTLWWLAIASFVAAPMLALLSGQDAQFLAYAAALFLLMAVPGWLLMRSAARG